MSNQAQAQQTQQSENKKSPFDQTFLCPKCSQILFTKIFYFEGTNTPQVQFTCPKKHNGVVDLVLFFDLFYPSNHEIENELSKIEEELEKQIENHQKKKLLEKQKAEEEKDSKNKSKSKDKNIENKNEENNNENEKNTNENKNKNNEIICGIVNNKNNKSFKELEKCNVIEFTLYNYIKNEANKTKDSNSTTNINNNNINIDNSNSNINKNIINKNIIKKKSKEKKSLTHKISNNINLIKKKHSSEKNEQLNEEKFICKVHNKSHVGYCLSCKKNICKKCLKTKKHKTKMFKHMRIHEKNLNELNKLIGQCQESLNKLEKKCKILIDSISLNTIEDKKEKTILYIMSNNLIEINKEYLSEVKSIIKNYNNCIKNKTLNYEIIQSMKNIKIKNNIIIPNDIQDLLAMIKDYKEYLFEKNCPEENNNNYKYLLFDTFNEIRNCDESLSENEKDVIKFSDIIENEKFRNLINLCDFKNEDLNEKIGQDEKEMEIEKIGYDLNDCEDGDDTYDLLDDEEEENEYENDDEYGECDEDEDIINDEDENNYGDNENGHKRNEDK